MVRIKEFRLAAGLTQAELAKKIGVTRSAVALWETKGKNPKAHDFPKVAEALHCTIDELFGRSEGDGTGEDSVDEKAACSGRGYKRLEKMLSENFDDSDSSITIKTGDNINSD